MTVTYDIDRGDNLVNVFGQWERASAGDTWLRPDEVLGRPIWDFVCFDGVRWIYREMLGRVRANQRSLEFEYRCDSRDEVRLMRMTISPRPADGARFESSLVEKRPRPEPVDILLGKSIAIACNICARVRMTPSASGAWCEVEDLLRSGHLATDAGRISVAYGICPNCRTQLQDLMALEDGA